jgi:iron-sulfur cluster assembly accessory protein
MTTMTEAPIQLTEAAIERVKSLMARADKPVVGLRVTIKPSGCSGHSYVVEYAETQLPLEDIVEQDGARVFIDPMATMFLFGAKMDYVEGKLEAGFTFENPNEKGRCGCGESFQL